MATQENNRYNQEDLDYFKKLILDEKAKLLKGLSEQNTAKILADASNDSSHYSNHLGDTAADDYNREFALALTERQAQYVEQLDDALQRIADGVYGICAVTGKLIPKERLEVVLVAKQSVEGKELSKMRAR